MTNIAKTRQDSNLFLIMYTSTKSTSINSIRVLRLQGPVTFNGRPNKLSNLLMNFHVWWTEKVEKLSKIFNWLKI